MEKKTEDGVITYHMSEEEVRERYGSPRLLADDKESGEAQAENYLKEKAVRLKDEARWNGRGRQ